MAKFSLFKSLRGESTSVGLDIGTYAIKLVKIRQQKDGIFLDATGIQELPPGTIEGSDIKNKDALISALTTLINKCDPSIVEVVVSMSGHGIISDRMTFKVETGENPEELILWQATQRSPFDVDDITLDYKILKHNEANNEFDVLVVAAKNQIMQHYIDLLYEAGLKPVMVDVDAFAVTNAYALSCGDRNDTGNVALINIGHQLTSVSFIKDGVYHSNRDISTAGEFFGKIVQRNLGVSPEEAAAILKGRTNKALDRNVLWQSIDYAAEELSSGIDLAFSYFKSSEKSDTIDKIVLSGGGAYIPNLVEFLEKRHDTVVQISNPLAYLQYDPAMFGSLNPQNISSLLTVAVGLGLRKV
jgi:type IV pilus assembly protein PilM